MSKVNRNGNVLKLANSPNNKSIYPMLDEFGYNVQDFFIFKSTWDYEYHYECVPSPIYKSIVANQSVAVAAFNNNTIYTNLNLL